MVLMYYGVEHPMTFRIELVQIEYDFHLYSPRKIESEFENQCAFYKKNYKQDDSIDFQN